MDMKERIERMLALDEEQGTVVPEELLAPTRGGVAEDFGEEALCDVESLLLRGYLAGTMTSISLDVKIGSEAARRDPLGAALGTIIGTNREGDARMMANMARLRVVRDELVRRGLW